MTMEQGKSSVVDGNASLAGEELYRQFFEEAIEGICLADPETGIIHDCNQAFSCLTGYERSELIGQSHTIYHRKEDIRPPFSSTFALHRSEKKGMVLNDLIVTKSGKLKEVEIKASVIELGGRRLMHAFFRDMTDELRGQRERETSLELMRLLNDRNHTHELIRNLTEYLQKWSGCDAVGIRLREGDDFPYFEKRGFSKEFLEVENYLCQRDLDGQVIRDQAGNPILECMCGNILCGRFDPTLPFFTANGSFWTNCTTELLATTTEKERHARTRNRCNAAGYESVALIPLRHGDRIMGLLQLNNRAPGRFTREFISFLENISCQIAITLAQREARRALEASEERYHRLFEVESDTIFLVDNETLRIIDVNGTALKLYGYTREEFLQLKISDVSAEPEKTLQSISRGELCVSLRWHRKKDGTVFPVEITISYFDYQGRKIHVAAIRDITERRQAEEAIRKSQQQNEILAKIIEFSSQPFTVGYADGRLGLFNTAFQQLLGYSKEELKTIDWLNTLTPPEWRAISVEKLEELRHHGPSIRYEKEYFRKDGTRVPVELLVHAEKNDGGEVLYYHAFITDISERRRTEAELTWKNVLLLTQQEVSLDGLLAVDGDDNVILRNQRFNELWNIPSELMDSKSDSPILQAVLKQVVNPKQFLDRVRYLYGHRNEKSHDEINLADGRIIDRYSTPLFGPDNNYYGRVWFFRDITERKQMEDSLRESEERYRRLFENMIDACAYHRMIFENGEPRDYVFLMVNEAFEAMTGLKNVCGRKVSEVIPGIRESNPELFAIYGRVATTGIPERLESFVESLNAWYSISVYSSEKDHFTTVFDNISARKKTEIALQKSEELFSKAFHCSPMAMAITSLVDHRYIDVNESFERSTGYSRKDVVGRDFQDIDMWREPEIMQRAMWLIQNEGKYRDLECAIRNKAGEHRIGRLSAESVEIAGERCTLTVAEDITERKQAEISLRKSEELFSKAFQSSPLAMVVTSLVDRRIIDVNEAFETITGYTRNEVVGNNFISIGLFVEFQALEQAIRAIAESGKYRGFEVLIRTKSGKQIFAQLSAETVEIAYEQCVLTVADDITERKQAADSLKQYAREKSELLEKMNEAQSLAMIGSWERDLQTNHVWWSDETYCICGVNRKTFVPSIEANGEFVHPGDFSLYRDSFEHSLRTGEPLEIDVRLIVNGGRLKHCHIMGKIVTDDTGQPIRFAGTIMDITEKKLAENAMRANEERFRLTFEHIGSGMVVYEAEKSGEDFIIKEFNPAAERICHLKRNEVFGRRLSQVFPSVKDIGLFSMLQRVWRTGVSERLPACFYGDDRLSFWAENDIFKLPTGEIVAIFEDITDRKLAESELQKSETWHRSLIELGVSVYMVLDEKQQIHYSSPLVESVFGWKPAEVFRKPISEFIAAEEADMEGFFTEIMRVPKRKKRIHARIRCKDGESKVMEIFGINLLDEPAVKGIVLSSHDITEQVQAQERLESFREELAHASRMASLGAMAAGIAHEINQPLSIMTTWTEIAMREIRDNLSGDKREAFLSLQRIDSALERSAAIIRNMRDFARKAAPCVTSVFLAEAIEEVQQFLAHQLRIYGIDFLVEMDPSLPPALADQTQIQQVLLNLILNAVEAMKSTPIEPRRVEIRVKVGDGLLEVAVSDSGTGIAPDQLESIFEPFHSTKAEGLGLGLSICRSIIHWHSGRIWAARNAERGTTITFTLPIAKENHCHATESHHLHRGRRTRSS